MQVSDSLDDLWRTFVLVSKFFTFTKGYPFFKSQLKMPSWNCLFSRRQWANSQRAWLNVSCLADCDAHGKGPSNQLGATPFNFLAATARNCNLSTSKEHWRHLKKRLASSSTCEMDISNITQRQLGINVVFSFGSQLRLQSPPLTVPKTASHT